MRSIADLFQHWAPCLAVLRSPAVPRCDEASGVLVPWDCDHSQVEIADSYEAEITGTEADGYLVAFTDTDGGIVEASMRSQDFAHFPHDVRVGTRFSIVVFRRKGTAGTTAAAWPVPKYWRQGNRQCFRGLPDGGDRKQGPISSSVHARRGR